MTQITQVYRVELQKERDHGTYKTTDSIEVSFTEFEDAVSFSQMAFDSVNGDLITVKIHIEQIEEEVPEFRGDEEPW